MPYHVPDGMDGPNEYLSDEEDDNDVDKEENKKQPRARQRTP